MSRDPIITEAEIADLRDRADRGDAWLAEAHALCSALGAGNGHIQLRLLEARERAATLRLAVENTIQGDCGCLICNAARNLLRRTGEPT